MIEILKYATSDIWKFAGTYIIIELIIRGAVEIIETLIIKRK